METETRIGQSGKGDSSSLEGVGAEANRLDLQQRVVDLEKRAKAVADDFQELKQDIKEYKNFMFLIVGAIALVFVVTSLMIADDYLRNNEERYENFINRAEEIKQDFYTKEQIDNKINFSFDKIKDQLDNFKKCLNNGGWKICF